MTTWHPPQITDTRDVENHRRHYQPLCDSCAAFDAERKAS